MRPFIASFLCLSAVASPTYTPPPPDTIPKAPIGFETPKSTGSMFHVAGCQKQENPNTFTTDVRKISNKYMAQGESESRVAPGNWNAYTWAWGQFIDHDMVRSTVDAASPDFNIKMDKNFPDITAKRMALTTGAAVSGQCRVAKNLATSEIDASMIYGDKFNSQLLNGLRVKGSCKLKLSADGHLPEADFHGLKTFLAGDPRASENIVLSTLHLIFVMEHNSICDKLNQNPATAKWTPDEKFWKARQVIVAKVQKITYEEWLPIILGKKVDALFDEVAGIRGFHDRKTDLATEFATAGFRFGHSMVGNKIGAVSLKDAFFNNALFKSKGLTSVCQDALSTSAQHADNKLVFDLRNILFGQRLNDLASRNIFRGREIGLASYKDVKAAYKSLGISLYHATPDVFPAILSELNNPFSLSLVSPTVRKIVGEQFARLKKFDPNFYTQPNRRNQIGEPFWGDIQQTTLGGLLKKYAKLNVPTCSTCGFRVKKSGW